MIAYPEYAIGEVVNGFEITGPVQKRNNKKYYPVRCVTCNTIYLKFGSHLNTGRHGCQRCYFNGRKHSKETLGARQVMRTYKSHAKEASREFSLSLQDVINLIESPCTYCGAEDSNKLTSVYRLNEDFEYNGIDRVDSSQGYSVDNTVSCCWDCNRMKGKMGSKEFLRHVYKILSYRQSLRDFSEIDDDWEDEV